jgi:hypothetical protein
MFLKSPSDALGIQYATLPPHEKRISQDFLRGKHYGRE